MHIYIVVYKYYFIYVWVNQGFLSHGGGSL